MAKDGKFSFFLEMLDMIKDYMLLYSFYHRPWASILLILSITLPIAFVDWDHAYSDGYQITFAHNMLIYLGLACESG